MKDRSLVVLAFGKLSLLELCSLLGKHPLDVRMICDRVALVNSKVEERQIEQLAGIHKIASPVVSLSSQNYEESIRSLLKEIVDYYEKIPNFALSAYCDDSTSIYEEVLGSLLDNIRGLGFRKSNLIRPPTREMRAEDVLTRQVLDFVLVNSGRDHLLATTVFVPDAAAFHERGTRRPVTSPEIALSPRLARALLNLSGLSKGETLLDLFCGSGTIISEGALMSLNSVGLDSNPIRVSQARQNLAWLEKESRRQLLYRIEVGDARDLGRTVHQVDGIVTEPILLPRLNHKPSPEKAKELVERASRVYAEALLSMAKVLREGGRAVIVVPAVKSTDGSEVWLGLQVNERIGLREFQPGHARFEYPLRVGFESTRWVGRGVYVFERV